MAVRGRSGNYLKNYNNKLVARLLLDNKYSCIEISKKIKLSHTALALIMERLMQRDLVQVVENDETYVRHKGGQHVRYTINSECAMFLCVNLQHEHECFVLCDLKGNEIFKEKLNVGKASKEIVYDIISKIKDRFKTLNINEEKIKMVSVAISGQLNVDTGEIIFSSKVDKDVNLKEIFAGAFSGAEVQIRNDVEYCCVASIYSQEFEYENDCVLFLYVGAGLSCCLTSRKMIIKNSIGFGGEIGGEKVNENFTLSNALDTNNYIRYCREITGNSNLEMKEALLLVDSNEDCRSLLEKNAKYLAQTISNFTYVVGCNKIVFSGQIKDYPKFFFDKLREYIKQNVHIENIEYEFMFTRFSNALSGQIYLTRERLIEKIIEE